MQCVTKGGCHNLSKFPYSEKATKSPSQLEGYYKKFKSIGRFCQIFVAFPKYVDFKQNELLTLIYISAYLFEIVKFIYSKKATKFCEIFTYLLTTEHTVKS